MTGVRVFVCGLVIGAIVFCPRAFSQDAADVPIRVDVTVVNALCTVRNAKGLVRDLERKDFQLLEDGRPATIRYFARQMDLPLTVALLLDVSGSVMNFVEAEKATARKFLEQVLQPTDSAAVFGFGSSVAQWSDFTSSTERLKLGLARVRDVYGRPVFPQSRNWGGTLLHDAVHIAAQKLEGKTGAKTVVLISDGEDNGSYLSVVGAIRSAQAVEAVVHTICYVAPRASRQGCQVLKRISDATGGRSFQVGKKTSTDSIFDAIREEIRSAYLIGFTPSGLDNYGFHKLEIRTTPQMTVRARKGYYIPKPRAVQAGEN